MPKTKDVINLFVRSQLSDDAVTRNRTSFKAPETDVTWREKGKLTILFLYPERSLPEYRASRIRYVAQRGTSHHHASLFLYTSTLESEMFQKCVRYVNDPKTNEKYDEFLITSSLSFNRQLLEPIISDILFNI